MDNIMEILKDSITQAGLIKNLSPEYIILTMLVSVLCAAIIYIVYRAFYRGVAYSENFNILNVLTCLVTAFVILTIASNLVLSLGMVGALSIVRFRAAIKDPLDIGFLFWSVAAGLTAGAGLYPFALIGTIFIALVFIGLSYVGKKKNTYLLVVQYTDNAFDEISKVTGAIKKTLKSKSKTREMCEVTYQLKLTKDNENILDTLLNIDGVNNAILVEFSGDNV